MSEPRGEAAPMTSSDPVTAPMTTPARPSGGGGESSAVIEFDRVTKVYRTGSIAVAALRGVTM